MSLPRRITSPNGPNEPTYHDSLKLAIVAMSAIEPVSAAMKRCA
jgi:hypothetical protein